MIWKTVIQINYVSVYICQQFQIFLAVYLLWNTLGVPVLAGLGLLLLLVPFNGVIAYHQQRLQHKNLLWKDKRIKMVNEVLSGIKVIFEPSLLCVIYIKVNILYIYIRIYKYIVPLIKITSYFIISYSMLYLVLVKNFSDNNLNNDKLCFIRKHF